MEALVGLAVIHFECRPMTAARKASSARHLLSHSFEDMDHEKSSRQLGLHISQRQPKTRILREDEE